MQVLERASASRWLTVVGKRPDAPVQLVCLPHAGGTAATFRSWPDRLADAAEVIAARLPGRGPRRNEPPVDDLAALSRKTAAAVTRLVDRPFALYGHSMGALLAFEVARELRRAGRGPAPELLVACAYPAPRLPRRAKPISGLSAPRFASELRRLGGIPPEVLGHRDLMLLSVPALRADFAACESYRYMPEEPLTCPVVVVGGTRDRLVERRELLAWKDETSGPTSIHMLDAGHFLPSSHEDELVTILAGTLRRLAPTRTSRSETAT